MTSKERKQRRFEHRQAKRKQRLIEFRKQYDDFDLVFTFDNLWKSSKKCFKGVGWKSSTQKFRNNAISNLAEIYLKLKKGKYKSKGFYCFNIIERGKLREIKSVHISERVVQRCLCDYALVPMFARTLIYDNGASIKGKGIDFSKNRIVHHIKRYYRRNGSNEGYALIADFSSYFDSILHERLEVDVRKLFTDERIIKLYLHFVKMFGQRGLGLGSQISQISAIQYANKLDYAVKYRFRIEGYARYNDDFYLIHESKEYLNFCLSEIKEICVELGIRLNHKKTQIVKLKRGIPFLKLRVAVTETGRVLRIPKLGSFQRMSKKLKVFPSFLEIGKMTERQLLDSYNATRSHLLRYNAHKRIRHMDERVIKIIKENRSKWQLLNNTPT